MNGLPMGSAGIDHADIERGGGRARRGRHLWGYPVVAWVLFAGGLAFSLGAVGVASANGPDLTGELATVLPPVAPSEAALAQRSQADAVAAEAPDAPTTTTVPATAEATTTIPPGAAPTTAAPAPSGVGSGVAGGSTAIPASAATPSGATSPGASTGAGPSAAPATPATTPPAAAPSPFGPGVNLVGRDVTPGRYVASEAAGCYWARLAGTSGRIEDILTNDNMDGQVVVDILPSDVAFDSERCGTWTPYAPGTAPVSSFGDGIWVAGEQIAAGTYEAVPDTPCYWARNADAAGDSIIANDNAAVYGAVVSIAAGEVFKSSGCGTWQAV